MCIMHGVSCLESYNFSPSIFSEVFFNLSWGPSEIDEIIVFWWADNFNFSSDIIFVDISIDIYNLTMVFISSIYLLSFSFFTWFPNIRNVDNSSGDSSGILDGKISSRFFERVFSFFIYIKINWNWP